jgi:hypothetical protein
MAHRMKLHWSPRSPFARKVMIVAHEVGVADRLQCVRTVAATSKENAVLMADNRLQLTAWYAAFAERLSARATTPVDDG